MKVVYILPYDWGAMPQYTAEIANAVSNYAEVTVIGSKNIKVDYFSERVKIIKAFDAFKFSINDIKNLFSLNTLKGFFSFKKIDIINKINPDIIHLTTPLIPPLLYLKFFGLDKKFPIIYTKHGIFSNSGFKIKIFEEYILGSCEKIIKFNKIIVHTQNDKEQILNFNHVDDEKVIVIPHGVYSFFRKYGETHIPERNCILFFGNIRDYKGLRYLIQAVPIMLKEIPELKVIIAGEGDISEFSPFFKKYENVFEIYNEFIPDELVSELFQRSEVVVMPYTIMSGQSGIANIALAFNKPTVASDVGSINEIVVNEITGFLVPPKDPDALARATIRILKNQELRRKMEINMEVRSHDLSWDNVAKKYINLYKEIRTETCEYKSRVKNKAV